MKFPKAVKGFIVYLTYATSKIFLYPQATFQNFLIDTLLPKINYLNNSFKTISNNIGITEKAVQEIKLCFY